jgi:hypothetical protein
MKCEMSVKLMPMAHKSPLNGKTYIEQVLMYLDGYPCGLFHVDTFYAGGGEVYDQLYGGATVEGTLTITAPDPDGEED